MIAQAAKRKTISENDVVAAMEIHSLGVKNSDILNSNRIRQEKTQMAKRKILEEKKIPMTWGVITKTRAEALQFINKWLGAPYHSSHIEKDYDSSGNLQFHVTLSSESQAAMNRYYKERAAKMPKGPSRKEVLRDRARLLGIKGFSKMSEAKLAKAIGDKWGPW